MACLTCRQQTGAYTHMHDTMAVIPKADNVLDKIELRVIKSTSYKSMECKQNTTYNYTIIMYILHTILYSLYIIL